MIDTLALLIELFLLFLALYALVRKESRKAAFLSGIFAYRDKSRN